MDGVRNNGATSRYELAVDGHLAVATYERKDGVVTFTHTIVPEAVEGRGVGSRLIAAALRDVREQGLRIIPRCSFVAAYLERHPEVQDLLAAG